MSTYRVNALGGGIGYKVQVADDRGGLRVVGIFPTEEHASAWIDVDRSTGIGNADRNDLSSLETVK